MKGVYRYELDCGRMGAIESVFIASHADVEKAKTLRLYFGEVLGKHSEISDDGGEGTWTLLSGDPSVVRVVEQYELSSGPNPLNCVEENEDGEEDE